MTWTDQARATLTMLLVQAANVGMRIGNREAAGEEPGPDPKSVEALVKLIEVVAECVTSGEVLEKGGKGDGEDE